MKGKAFTPPLFIHLMRLPQNTKIQQDIMVHRHLVSTNILYEKFILRQPRETQMGDRYKNESAYNRRRRQRTCHRL